MESIGPLVEVVSKDEVDPDALVPIWGAKGKLTMKRSKVQEPSIAEELRRRLTIMRNAMVVVSLRHTNRVELQGEYEKVIEDNKNYICGNMCMVSLRLMQRGAQ